MKRFVRTILPDVEPLQKPVQRSALKAKSLRINNLNN